MRGRFWCKNDKQNFQSPRYFRFLAVFKKFLSSHSLRLLSWSTVPSSIWCHHNKKHKQMDQAGQYWWNASNQLKSTETHLIRFQIKARANLFQLHRLRATTFFIDMVPAKNIYLYICMVKDFPLTKVSNLIDGLLRGPFTIRLRYSEFTYGIEHLCHNIHRNKKLSRSEATWSGRDNLKIS